MTVQGSASWSHSPQVESSTPEPRGANPTPRLTPRLLSAVLRVDPKLRPRVQSQV